MARPRRASIETWYDLYADMDLEDQAAALKILEQVHRLAVRESKRGSQPVNGDEPEEQKLPGVE